jgi:hypothetical protein
MSLKGVFLVPLVVLATTVAWPSSALAAAWCGTVATDDRPAVVGGLDIRVVYAVPADGADASAGWAPRMSADVDSIDAWWRANDSSRAPRFDLAAFSCGPQADVTLARLARSAADLAVDDTRFNNIADDPQIDKWFESGAKVLVYYDGPVTDGDLCGESNGSGEGVGLAIVYLAACPGEPTDATAAHELLHAFGAVAEVGPRNQCPDDSGHVCDSTLDVLYPFGQSLLLSSLILDVNRDDYYAHGGAWLDVRKSNWLRWLDAQSTLDVAVRGTGTVLSNVPGVECSVPCRQEFNTGTQLALGARAGRGQRFVSWSGACSSTAVVCELDLTGPLRVTAFFAPARFRLAVAVRGQGRVVGTGISCPSRCAGQVVSYRRAVLRAVPARGWKLKAWGGACRGARPTCALPMKKASAARATFVRS